MNQYDKNYVDLHHSINQTPLLRFDSPSKNTIRMEYQSSYVSQIEMERRRDLDENYAAHYRNSHQMSQRPISPGFKQIPSKWEPTNPQKTYSLKKPKSPVKIDNSSKYIKLVNIEIEEPDPTQLSNTMLRKRKCNPQVMSIPTLKPCLSVKKMSIQ
ncbi:Hypothetical_protein [Hexamita inflata]|uniref:Hypothetical_protein n=1 Tax=Hexamita inflata TaxID=28002 RepID=A0AA86NP98_9EUKA|nr:Hypothetical protein HINF_LOCUS10181 [Hexamita inflata]